MNTRNKPEDLLSDGDHDTSNVSTATATAAPAKRRADVRLGTEGDHAIWEFAIPKLLLAYLG